MTLRKINILVIVLAVVLTAGFTVFLLIPGTKKLGACRSEIKQRVETIRQEQARVGNLGELYARIVELDEKLRDFGQRLPRERQFGEFLKSLSDRLSETGVSQSSVQQKAEFRLDATRLPPRLANARNIGILPVQVSFSGTCEQVFEFIRSVESMSRLAHVEAMKLVNDETAPSRVSADLTIHTYYHAGDDQLASASKGSAR